MIEEQGGKQIDIITNQNERLASSTDKNDHKYNYKEIFEELVKERFDKMKDLTDEINQNDLIYYFKGSTFRKRSDDFSDSIELCKERKSGETKLEEAKKTTKCD